MKNGALRMKGASSSVNGPPKLKESPFKYTTPLFEFGAVIVPVKERILPGTPLIGETRLRFNASARASDTDSSMAVVNSIRVSKSFIFRFLSFFLSFCVKAISRGYFPQKSRPNKFPCIFRPRQPPSYQHSPEKSSSWSQKRRQGC